MFKKNLVIALTLLGTSSFGQLPSYLPSSDLMAWFPFSGNAVDSTGHGHDGVVFGTTNGAGRYGVSNTAFRFNGTSDYIFVPAGTLEKDKSIDITASLTISAWVKSDNYGYSSQEQIYWRGDATSAHDPHMLYLNGGQLRVRRDVDPGSTVSEVGTSFSGLDTNYHLFTGTYDSASGRMRIYIDGIMKNSSYMPGLQTYPTSTMYNYIGAVDGGTWQFFYGLIDELAIWSRALTPCEIAALYGSVPDIITLQPVNDTVITGGSASFTVGVTAPAITYKWQVNMGSGFVNLSNSSPYSGVNTATLTISPVTNAMSGNWYRCLVSSDSCVNVITDSAKLKVDTTTTYVKNLTNKMQLTVSPNPSSGVFLLKGNLPADRIASIEVIDNIGQVIYKEDINTQNGIVNKTIHLGQEISNGIYVLRVTHDSLSEAIQLIIGR